MRFALAGARVFDGVGMRDGLAVVIGGGTIEAIVPETEMATDVPVRRIAGLLAPGFIDVQVNGGGGVLFNDERSLKGIRAIGRAHRRFGTTGFLPTFVTDARERMPEAVEAAREALAAHVPGVLGIHLEGPFLNPARKGVHEPRFMRPVEPEDIRVMTSLGAGRTLVTLAPEMTGMAPIKALTDAGVIVSAGHTAADAAILDETRGMGLTGYTHLFNAMPPLAGREPGPVGAALAERDTWCSIIADIHHVSVAALKTAVAAKGVNHIMLISDAMPLVGADRDSFYLQGRSVIRRNGRLTTADGTLAGSDLDMASAVRNAVDHLGVRLEDALAMASRVPAAFLRLDSDFGRIAPGYRASMVLLDEALTVMRTWIDGEEEVHAS
jgi:N-acetylglucosamine-6-phosphate deacetylase